MEIISAKDINVSLITGLIYCQAGVGKTTALGKIADAYSDKGKTLILDVDRTTRVLKDNPNIDIAYIDNVNTWNSWESTLKDLGEMKKNGLLDQYACIAVDNVSELERCILSNLGSAGKNKGVPAQADYQYMQFKLVNSLRFMKSLGKNLFWTSWEISEQFTHPDGTQYTRLFPKINGKIVDNICGLCDFVGKILINKDGKRIMMLQPTQNIYCKNQIDNREFTEIDNFVTDEMLNRK